MLVRISRGLANLSPYVIKQQPLIGNYQRFIRPLSQSSVLNGTKQIEDTETDLTFDLGGTKSKEKKVKKPSKKVTARRATTNVKEKIPSEKKERSFEQLKYHDLALDLTYVKLPFNHPEFSNLMLMLKSRKYRETKNLLLVEGRRLTLEAIEAGLKLRYLLFSNVKQVEDIRPKLSKSFIKETELIRVPHNDLSFWSTLSTCPGLITVFERPADMNSIWDNSKLSAKEKLEKQQQDAIVENVEHLDELEKEIARKNRMLDSVPITVICDQVREPNNLGSIIRTCASVPCDRVILLKGCADPWDIKSLRGGCGAQFRIPIVGPIEWEDLESHLPAVNELSVFIADNKSDDQQPLIERDEYETKRKQNNEKYFPTKVYSDIPFHNCKHIALIVGGETEGVSSHAFDFMNFVSKQAKAQGEESKEIIKPDNSVIEIPLGNGVESLNASVATAVLLFEMRKQIKE